MFCSECKFYHSIWNSYDKDPTCNYVGPEGTAPCESDIYVEEDNFVNSYVPLESEITDEY